MPVPEDGIPGWDRTKLKAALHACDSHALVAFYTHFRPILVERAHLFGIPRSERADAVETFLGDMLVTLCSAPDLPKSVHAYLFVSFKRYAFRIGKARRIEIESLEEFAGTLREPIKAVAEQRAHYSNGAPELDVGHSGSSSENSALARFASALLNGLTAEDKLILGAKAEEMPLREVASMLGMNYNAANTRLFRLRSRLRLCAPGVAAQMDSRDRPIVERFLRRARESGNSSLGRIDSSHPVKAKQGGL
jgi:DNA-directed RNA polymerase specialized sigma24 family protein